MGSLAMNRLFKSTVEPIVKKHLNQPKRYIMTRLSNRSRQKAVGTRQQSSESGNPRSPNGENTWDVPVFGKITLSNAFQNVGVAGTLIGVGITIWTERQKQVSEGKKSEGKDAMRNLQNLHLVKMWLDLADSREAILHRHDDVPNGVFPFLYTWIVTNIQSRHGGAKATNKSTVVNTKPAPKSVADVMFFFLVWQSSEESGTINSAVLKQQLGSQINTFQKALTEIREKEAEGWHKTDKDNLNTVLHFLDEISNMEKEGSSEAKPSVTPDSPGNK